MGMRYQRDDSNVQRLSLSTTLEKELGQLLAGTTSMPVPSAQTNLPWLSTQFHIGGQQYRVDFGSMHQINILTRTTRKVVRVASDNLIQQVLSQAISQGTFQGGLTSAAAILQHSIASLSPGPAAFAFLPPAAMPPVRPHGGGPVAVDMTALTDAERATLAGWARDPNLWPNADPFSPIMSGPADGLGRAEDT